MQKIKIQRFESDEPLQALGKMNSETTPSGRELTRQQIGIDSKSMELEDISGEARVIKKLETNTQ